jgi:predicted alpha/beta hydrolase family esterase
MRYVIVPGIGDSGPDHWQSLWQAGWGDRAVRIEPASWDEPDLEDWVAALARVVEPDDVLVAHSLGTLAVAAWFSQHGRRAAGAFLVAVPDPAGPGFPTAAPTFRDPGLPIPGPAVVVGSTDDPYSTTAVTVARAATWRAAYVELGPVGHVNGASGLGDWPEGRRLLTAFEAGINQ